VIGFGKFLRATLVGGVMFLVPVVVLAVILGKALEIARKVTDPLAARIPVHSVIGLQTPTLLAAFLIVLLCFLAGLLARMRTAARAVRWLESTLLSNIPGYEFFKAVSGRMIGADVEGAPQAVLVYTGDSWQIGFEFERLDNGLAAVYVPEGPACASGPVMFVPPERLSPLGLSPAAAMKCLRRLGAGSNALLGRYPPGMPPGGFSRERGGNTWMT
jgi:uncharacterized membrane protein